MLLRSKDLKVELNIRRNHMEYVVVWTDIINQKTFRNEAKCYYTDDIDDARSTMRAMMRHYNDYGN